MRDVCDCLTNVSSSLLNNATCYLRLLFLSIIWPPCFQYTYASQERYLHTLILGKNRIILKYSQELSENCRCFDDIQSFRYFSQMFWTKNTITSYWRIISQRYDSEEIFTRSNESKYFSKRSQKRSLAKWLKCKNKRSRSSFSWNVSKDESRRGNRFGTQLFSTRKSSCHCTRE